MQQFRIIAGILALAIAGMISIVARTTEKESLLFSFGVELLSVPFTALGVWLLFC